MSYVINIMHGKDVAILQRYRFESIAGQGDKEFDMAVKEINKLYKENGRYETVSEILNHFNKYGFRRSPL